MKNLLGIYYAFLASSDEVDWLDCMNRAKTAGLSILEMSAPKLRVLSASARGEIAAYAKASGLKLNLLPPRCPRKPM